MQACCRILAGLPEVARVLRLCTEDDPWCVLSEYAADGDLCHYLRKKRLEGGEARLYSNVLESGRGGGGSALG